MNVGEKRVYRSASGLGFGAAHTDPRDDPLEQRVADLGDPMDLLDMPSGTAVIYAGTTDDGAWHLIEWDDRQGVHRTTSVSAQVFDDMFPPAEGG